MAAVAETNPLFELLRDIETRSRNNAMGLPQQVEIRQSWSGIGFRIGEVRLVAPFGEVSEVLSLPVLTKVPSARPWVLGLANVRGTLLPILDLGMFVEGCKTSVGSRTRFMIVNQKGVMAGVVVDEVFGLRHFYEEEHTDMFPQVSQQLMDYLDGAYQQKEIYWGIFSMLRLCQDPHFAEVASRA
ncbi:MAG: chemotaxis protein CheW [Gammaproteobacteria bacterium]|nr:chemotaxis protein CheW [Gammaproteobacteria bacterium]